MKSNKMKGLLFVAAMGLLASGCSMPEKGKTVVIIEDVKSESALVDGNLKVERQTDIEIGREISNNPYRQPVKGDVIHYNEKGLLYSLDLPKGTPGKVADREAFTVSENGKWALSFENEEGELYVHNLQTGEMNMLENASPDDTRFLENDVFYRYFTTQTIVRVNPETNERETWDMSEFENYTLSYMAKEQDGLYIAAQSVTGGWGIYQLIENEVIENVWDLPNHKDEISDFSILDNGKLLFQGTVEGKNGVFYWNTENDELKKIISGGEDQEGKWISFYNLSPDKSKVLYDMPVQIGDDYKSNVYMAELIDGELVNSTRIMENADLYGVISLSGGWSIDSKKAYVKMTSSTSEFVGDIAVFQLNE